MNNSESLKSEKLFIPHELKTIEVDVEKKKFLVNGEPFGHRCSGFTISCDGLEGYKVRMEIDTTVIFEEFNNAGTLVSKEEYQRKNY